MNEHTTEEARLAGHVHCACFTHNGLPCCNPGHLAPTPDNTPEREARQGMRCDAQYGSNPDRCYLQFGHRGAHSNRWGTTWPRSSRFRPDNAE